MDNLLIALTNLGGGFALAAAILLLHRDALKAFREELQKEREANRVIHEAILDKIDGYHDQAMDVLYKLRDCPLFKKGEKP